MNMNKIKVRYNREKKKIENNWETPQRKHDIYQVGNENTKTYANYKQIPSNKANMNSQQKDDNL